MRKNSLTPLSSCQHDAFRAFSRPSYAAKHFVIRLPVEVYITLNRMKTYGYPAGAPLNGEGLVELAEVSFHADADAIRRIAQFLLKQADEMDATGNGFGHTHAQDEDRPWPKDWPDLIVVRAGST